MAGESTTSIALHDSLDSVAIWGLRLAVVSLTLTVGYWLVVAAAHANLVFGGQGPAGPVSAAEFRLTVQRATVLAKIMAGSGVVLLVCLLARYWSYEASGLWLLTVGALVGFGLPFAVSTLGGQPAPLPPNLQAVGNPRAIMATYSLGVGVLLIGAGAVQLLLLGIASWLASRGTRPQPTEENAATAAETRIPQDRFLGPCWTLPFCRDTQFKVCPIRHSKRPCWRDGRGCYCDQSVVLALAGGSRYAGGPQGGVHSRTPQVVPAKVGAEKREQCLGCPIYLHRQEQKYRLLAPAIILSTVGAVALTRPAFHQAYPQAVTWFGRQIGGISFGTQPGEIPAWVADLASNLVIEWVIVVLLSLLVVSYALHIAEWFLYKLGI